MTRALTIPFVWHVRRKQTLSAWWCAQVIWLRHFLGRDLVALLSWVGLRALPPSAAALERILRVKALVLVAIAFERRSVGRVFCTTCEIGTSAYCRAGHMSASQLSYCRCILKLV